MAFGETGWAVDRRAPWAGVAAEGWHQHDEKTSSNRNHRWAGSNSSPLSARSRWRDPGGDGRRVQEGQNRQEGSWNLGSPSRLSGEHRGHQQDQAGQQRDPQPPQSLAEEGSAGA